MLPGAHQKVEETFAADRKAADKLARDDEKIENAASKSTGLYQA